MLRLIQSNHMPALAHLFCEQTQRRGDPFEATTVIVQSFGIGQWLKLQLATHQGISANLDCLLPANYIWRLYRALFPDNELPQASPFDRERLTWRLMRLIPQAHHEVLDRYLDAPGDANVRLYQLSFQIAQIFDQYLVYRPEWPIAWEEGNPLLDADTLAGQQWQVSLWQQVIADAPELACLHRARLHQQLLNEITKRPALPPGVGQTLVIFGLSSLARMQLETFRALSEIIDVDVYFLNPCRHYWGDIVAPQDKARRSVRNLLGASGEISDDDFLTVGNPLLGSLGKQGREYMELLLETDGTQPYEAYVEPQAGTMLGQIQIDILDLTYGGDDSPTATTEAHQSRVIEPTDDSIQVHSAHSRMREVEILYDQLLAVFDRHPGIDARDVIVMAPDIVDYAPFINAVFKDRIHYGIADRTLLQQSTLIATFLKLLSLPDSRLTSVEVMDLLEVPAVARRFGLDEDSQNRIAAWINDTGIRWELEGKDKTERWQLPDVNVNTWRFGLDRLLLGYAMSGALYADRLPYPVEAADSELLGRLCHIIDLLDRTRRQFDRSHTADEWRSVLLETLNDFFTPRDSETLEIAQLQNVLDRMVSDTEIGQFEQRFSHQLMHFWLAQQLTLGHQVPGFITGGITFATLVPMRSIPFEVVCLLGMNDADFPREEKPRSFDLMAIDGPRKGDRSKRTDDRYLFLEALLSAQQIFYVSFEGRGTRDNQPRPPSTVVGELLDSITGLYPDFAVSQHPLQPFSHHYFEGGLISYQKIWYDALTRPPVPTPFISAELSPAEELEAESAEQLAGFLRHPAKYFLQHRLGVFFEDASFELRESESFVLDPLEKYQLAADALNAAGVGQDQAAWRREMIASGRVLDNTLGHRYLDEQAALAHDILDALRSLAGTHPTPVRDILTIDGRSISYAVSSLYGQRQIDIRPGQLHKRQLLEVWVRHLCLCAAGHEVHSSTVSRGRNGPDITEIDPVPPDTARTLLSRLLGLHHQGIRRPVHFLPECSFSFASTLAKSNSLDEAMRATDKQWQAGMAGSEGTDPYWHRLAATDDLFDEAFTHTAVEVYGPLIQHWSGA